MEYLIATIGALLVERGVDYLVRRNATTKELIRKTGRVVFDRVIAIYGDDKELLYNAYNRFVEAGLDAAKIKQSKAVKLITDTLFNELWEARQKDYWDTTMAQLQTAGKRAGKIAEVLQKIPG